MKTNVMIAIEGEELAEMKKLMRVEANTAAILSAARLGVKIERDRWMADEFDLRPKSAVE